MYTYIWKMLKGIYDETWDENGTYSHNNFGSVHDIFEGFFGGKIAFIQSFVIVLNFFDFSVQKSTKNHYENAG